MKNYIFIICVLFLIVLISGCSGSDYIVIKKNTTTTIYNSSVTNITNNITIEINNTINITNNISNNYSINFTARSIQCAGSDKLNNLTFNETGLNSYECGTDLSGGGGMVFNQNLNTSANVTFNNVSVAQNVTAQNFLGNINASYIFNSFWMTLSSFLLNVTSLNLQNSSQVNTTIQAYNYFNLTNITSLDYKNSTQLNQTYILNNTGNVSFNNVTTENLNVSATAVLNFTCMYWNTTSSSCQSYIYFNGTDSIWK